MSFPCPVEGCTAVYEDWPSLQSHLSEIHGQDITKESYDEWRDKVMVNEGTERQQQQEQQQNRDRTGPPITPLKRSVPTSVTSDTALICPICKKLFDRGDIASSFQSVRMHSIKSHGRQLNLSDFGLETEEGARLSPSRRRVTEREEEGRPSIPDPYEHLRQMLITFGLGDKNAGAVCKFMESYSVDDLFKLIEGAAEYLPRSRLKLFVESWANVRGIPIAPEIQEELGISNMPMSYGRQRPQQYDYRYGRRDRDWQPEPKDETDVLIDKEYRRAAKLRVIGALKGDDNSEVQGLRQEITSLRQMMRDGLSDSEGEKILKLEDEIKEKDRKLQQEREERHRNELKALEERMNTRIEMLTNAQGTVIERQGVKAAERLGDISERMVTLGEKLVVATAYKHNLLQEEAPIPRERQGPSGIEALIPKEYLDVERRGEAEAET